jgi:hypothetical protein
MTTSFAEAANAAAADNDFEFDGELYRHKKRPQWGVAILAADDGDVRSYQFEDGRLRKFKKGYFKLMEPVDEIRGSRETLVESLTQAAQEKGNRFAEIETLEPVAPFQAQVDLFLELYPKGFADEEWIADHRARESGSALKRHREPAITAVRETLSAEACQEWMAQEDYAGLAEALRSVLSSTDLVSLKHVRVLKGLEAEETKHLAEAVTDLLHGEDEYRRRFRGWLRVLGGIVGGRPSWRLATALPALAFPDEQTCVRHSAFKRQAAVISPRSRYSRKARVVPYENFRQVAFAVRKRLEAAGQEPRDLLDVYDFIWTTLRSAALDHLKS